MGDDFESQISNLQVPEIEYTTVIRHDEALSDNRKRFRAELVTDSHRLHTVDKEVFVELAALPCD
jgi:hypothetical protein